MIRNRDSRHKFITSFVAALIVHAAILALVKRPLQDYDFLSNLSQMTKNLKEPLKLEDIKIIKPSDVEKMRRVGIKGGKKDLDRPDIAPKTPTNAPVSKSSPNPLSMDKLAPNLPKPSPQKTVENKNGKKGQVGNEEVMKEMLKAPVQNPAQAPVNKTQNDLARNILTKPTNDTGGNFYYSYKKGGVIQPTAAQEEIKQQASRNFTAPQNKATDRISNFEIRYERPEGVSEDELNSDEKAYYSFYVRSYQNYFSKIYANYEKIVVERPGLASVFDKKHLLIGKIDYDENGNIVTVRILKSSENDDLHYFFEETLKQLSQPNPPKIFTKNRKQFSIYYQLQIN